ncbi:MAG: DUF4234 domain-containing protein [bacterium]|nr:DUF4234 domain-containing protein [bacterium]
MEANSNQVSNSGTPTGRIRSPLAPFGLGLITLGIYNLVWTYKILEEMRNHALKAEITSGGKAVGLLFVPLFNFFWAIYLWFRIPTCVNTMKSACNTESDRMNSAIGLVMIIPLIGYIIWSSMIQSSLNNHWRSHGKVI